MYRVMIVDDEPWIVQSIIETIPWAKYDMCVVGGFTRATKALEKMLAEEPDVVFTDIRMPVVSGIQLMQALREHHYETEIVVISGFDEFELVRASLRMGAFDYCLKPLNENYMEELLVRLKEKLDQKAKNKNNLLLEMLAGDFSQSENSSAHAFIPRQFEGYQVICVNGKEDGCSVLSLLPLKDIQYISFFSGRYQYYLINTSQNLFENHSVPSTLQTFCGNVGISHFRNSMRDIPALISEAASASEREFMNLCPGIFFYHEPRIDDLLSVIRRLEPFFAPDAAEDYALYAAEVSSGIASEELTIEELCFLGNQLILNESAKATSGKIDTQALCADWRELMERFSNAEDYCMHIFNVCQLHSPASAENGSAFFKESTIGQMVQYLNENYTSPIYLKDLAEKFYISKNYASLLFRKHMGMHYSDYLNSLRLKRAKELLDSTSLSIAEVAEQSGYTDYFYFNKLFKKTFGITPAKFRRQSSV